jgi:hypothetical protein
MRFLSEQVLLVDVELLMCGIFIPEYFRLFSIQPADTKMEWLGSASDTIAGTNGTFVPLVRCRMAASGDCALTSESTYEISVPKLSRA